MRTTYGTECHFAGVNASINQPPTRHTLSDAIPSKAPCQSENPKQNVHRIANIANQSQVSFGLTTKVKSITRDQSKIK